MHGSQKMCRHHVSPEPARRFWLIHRIQRRGNSRHIRRVHLGKTVCADGAMRQQDGFRDAARGGGLVKGLQHDWRGRQECFGSDRTGRCRDKPGHRLTGLHGRHAVTGCGKRQQAVFSEGGQRGHVDTACLRHRQQIARRAGLTASKDVRHVSPVTNADQDGQLASKNSVLVGKQRLGAIEVQRLTAKLGIERRHHPAGPVGNINIHRGGDEGQAFGRLLGIKGAPDKGPGQRRRLALMAGQCQHRGVGLNRGAAPQLCHPLMVDQSVTKRPPGRHKTGIRVEVAEPDRRLGRTFGKRLKTDNIDIMMRRLHQHDMKLVNQRRVDGAGIGVVQKLADKAGECRIINPRREKNVGGELCAGDITLVDGGADHFRLVPERLERPTRLIHHIAAGIGIAARHQLRFDKPLFPFKPRCLIGKLVNHHRQIF